MIGFGSRNSANTIQDHRKGATHSKNTIRSAAKNALLRVLPFYPRAQVPKEEKGRAAWNLEELATLPKEERVTSTSAKSFRKRVGTLRLSCSVLFIDRPYSVLGIAVPIIFALSSLFPSAAPRSGHTRAPLENKLQKKGPNATRIRRFTETPGPSGCQQSLVTLGLPHCL